MCFVCIRAFGSFPSVVDVGVGKSMEGFVKACTRFGCHVESDFASDFARVQFVYLLVMIIGDSSWCVLVFSFPCEARVKVLFVTSQVQSHAYNVVYY